MEKLFLLNIAFVLFLLFFGPDILGIVGKEAQLLTPWTMHILVMGQFFYSTFSVILFFLVTTQKSRLFLVIELLVLALCSLSGGFFVKQFGEQGAALTISLGYIFIALAAIALTIRYHAKDFLTRHTIQILVAGFISGIIMALLKHLTPSAGTPLLRISLITFICLTLYFALTTRREQWHNLLRW